MSRPTHSSRPYGWARLVVAEYEDAFEDFPDASNALVASMLHIDEAELIDCLRRAGKHAHRRPGTVAPDDESRLTRAERLDRRAQQRARYWRMKAERESAAT